MTDTLSPGTSPRTVRAQVIESYDLAGAREEGLLDDLAAFASELCHTPVALITLVEDDYQRFLAATGTDLPGTPSDISFCVHAIAGNGVMQVPDMLADLRFRDNPQVIGDPYVRFYAGAPLVSIEGVALGTVCVLDMAPREPLTPFQLNGLAILTRATMGRLEDRRAARNAVRDRAAQRRELADSEQRFATLADTMPHMVWSTQPDGFHDYYNARWYEFTGVPPGSTDGEAWNDMFHPEDQAHAWAVWRNSLATGDPYQIEYRLKHFDGTYRWVLGRALPIRDDEGRITRWFGTCTDIHAQKLAVEEREVISQELSHRIKNIFAVMSGLIGFAARAKPEFAGIANDLRQRITALGRAHDFVRPHSARSHPSAPQDSLHGLMADLFEPYRSTDGVRVRIEGEDAAIDDRSATPLALLFHELATNATKYGALSLPEGHVALNVTREDDRVVLIWQEIGGPAITKVAEPRGFGSQLIELSAVRQLGGTVERDWQAEGLVVRIAVPAASLGRS